MKHKRTAKTLLLACYFRKINNATPMERFTASYMTPIFAWIFRK